MSKYTTEVRFICETANNLSESEGYNSVENIIVNSLPKIFDFDFPIFDEEYRPILETKILKHYYTREICAETVGLWKLFLNERLNLIMSYYNLLYTSTLYDFNPFYDTDIQTTHVLNRTENTEQNITDNIETNATENVDREKIENATEDNTRTDKNNFSETVDNDINNYRITNMQTTTDMTTDTTNTETNKNTDRFSETPQGSLQNIENNTYLTNARIVDTNNSNTQKNKQTGTNKDTGTIEEHNGVNTNTTNTNTLNSTEKNTNNLTATDTENKTSKNTQTTDNNLSKNLKSTDDYIQKIVGKTGGSSYSTLLKEFRETFLNIDNMIIEELSDLFLNLF